MIVKPSEFYYLSLDNPDDDSSRYHHRMAVAPVPVYKWYDRALEERESEKTLNTIIGFMEAGGVTNGFVYFPGHPESTYLMFCFPVDDQEFQFVYQLLPNQ